MSYRERTRKTVTLPSGAVAVVVRLAPIHLIELGDIPLVDLREDVKRGEQKERTAKSMTLRWKLENLILKNCVLSFEFHGEKLTLVDKPPAKCEEGELSIHELEPDDVTAIQLAVNSLTDPTERRLPEGAKPFPEGQGAGGTASRNGESLRHSSDHAAAPVMA